MQAHFIQDEHGGESQHTPKSIIEPAISEKDLELLKEQIRISKQKQKKRDLLLTIVVCFVVVGFALLLFL